MVELKGTKTEANLKAAFAGESQAHTKYEYYASQAKKTAMFRFPIFFQKLHTMKRNMLKSGLNYCMEAVFRIQHPILKMRQKVKIMNGQVCIRLLQKKLEKKDLMK